MTRSTLAIRPMLRTEVDQLVDWAAAEGWNPGLHDADAFWATDPAAFVAADVDGVLAGGGAVTAYDGQYGFMGFFIMKPEYRGRGLGDQLWLARRDRLRARLGPDATIGMDGVFAMQPYYARGGFVFSHRNLRFRSDTPHVAVNLHAPGTGSSVPLQDVPFEMIAAYDRQCFPASRATFLRRWIALPDARALGWVVDGRLAGIGVVRRCRTGCKIGPLFADDFAIAETLYVELASFSAGGPLFLDVPEDNPVALALARKHGMHEVFGCARMYLGSKPDVANEKVFGVTTFELG